MTLREFKEKHPEADIITVWGEDTKGGFGKKGWTAYGDCNHCEIMSIEQRKDGSYKLSLKCEH